MNSHRVTRADICLISSSPPSSNPRLIKEASALSATGYRVHCVVPQQSTPLSGHDERLLADAGTSWTRISLGSRREHQRRRAAQLICSRIPSWLSSETTLARASSVQSLLLAEAASLVNAKLFIGHTLPALPAAVIAARNCGALVGFDAEDFHSGESSNPHRNRVARNVESRFIKACRHLTCAAPLIGDAYRAAYGVSITTILNTFELPNGFVPTARRRHPSDPLSLYWFSQTVGPGRGLEETLRAISKARRPVSLHCRGIVSSEYRDSLLALARSLDLKIAPAFLPPAAPDSMIPCAAEFDVGLSVEINNCANHNLCLANKIFTYLAAGRPQFMSSTNAQKQFAPRLGPAAILVDLDNPQAFGAALDQIAESPPHYERACLAAMTRYRDELSWDHEAKKLLATISQYCPVTAPKASDLVSCTQGA